MRCQKTAEVDNNYHVVTVCSSASHDDACVFAAESVNYADRWTLDDPLLVGDSKSQTSIRPIH